MTCGEENREISDCNCKDSYFGLDPDLECFKCHHFCATCELIPENCLECITLEFRELKPDCSCVPGYYNDENNVCS